MKLFKLALMGMTLAASLQSFAAQEGYGNPMLPPPPAPGSQHTINYSCTVPQKDGHMIVGAGYGLECSEAPVAPQYSIRGCTLLTRVVAPKAPTNREVLTEKSQDINSAQFVGQNVVVTVDKSDMSAEIDFGRGLTSTCTAIKK